MTAARWSGAPPTGGRFRSLVPERLQVVDSTNRYLVRPRRARGCRTARRSPRAMASWPTTRPRAGAGSARTWEAPPGTAVLCSVLLKPDLGIELLHLAASAVALAAIQACRATAGVELSLKWPNDLVAGGASSGGPGTRGAEAERKVAGILSEIVPPHETGDDRQRDRLETGGIVVGIGINVNWPVNWPPPDCVDAETVSIARSATSLNRIAGRDINRSELVAELLRSTGAHNAMLASPKGPPRPCLQVPSCLRDDRARGPCRALGRDRDGEGSRLRRRRLPPRVERCQHPDDLRGRRRPPPLSTGPMYASRPVTLPGPEPPG